MNRVRKLLLTTVAAGALVLGGAVSASADPALSVDANNGRRVVRVEHPDNPSWYVTVAVDTHLGFALSGDSGPEYASPASTVTDGPGALRFQVDNQRLRVAPTGAAAHTVVNDYFSSKISNPRNNTPTGGTETVEVNDACTARNGVFYGVYPLPRGESGSLYDERDPAGTEPKDGECEGFGDLFRNPLNSASDYEPDATVVRAFADWTNIGLGVSTSGQVIQRTFIQVRWANNDLTAHTVVSNWASFGV